VKISSSIELNGKSGGETRKEIDMKGKTTGTKNVDDKVLHVVSLSTGGSLFR